MATKKDNGPRRAFNEVVDAHAAIGHLIDEWDLTWEPHQSYAQLTAIEACLRQAERSLPSREREEVAHV